MDAGLHDVAAVWGARTESLTAGISEFRVNIYLLSQQSDTAAAHQDLPGLRHCYRIAKKAFGDRMTGRVKRWLRAVELNIALLAGARTTVDHAIIGLDRPSSGTR